MNKIVPELIPEAVKSVEGVELVDIFKYLGGPDDKAMQEKFCETALMGEGKPTDGFHYGFKEMAEGFLK